MSRDADRTEALRSDLVRAVVDATGMRETMAMPIANTVLAMLQDRYGGSKVYIPATKRPYDAERIAAAIAGGQDVAKVCRDHRISKRTLYRNFDVSSLRQRSSGEAD